MNTIIELGLGGVILLILAIFLNPTHLLMPDSVNAMLVLGFIITFLVFVGMVWKEKAGDERESFHIYKAGRLSFLVGVSILVLGIVVQASMHEVDPWLVFGLAGMVLAKLLSRVYHNFKN
jgi:cobalamin synthase